MSEQYTQLVGSGNSGDFVHTSQGVASKEGFSNVSQFWYPTTISFEDCMEKIENERKNRVDIKGLWSDWKFSLSGRDIVLINSDGQSFKPTEHCLNQACQYSSVIPSFVEKTISPEFQADDVDLEQLVDILNYRKTRHHKDNKGNQRELLFRTYGNSIRAVLSKQYLPVDNIWFLEVLQDLIPNGRISHLRGDADRLFSNILIPDSNRFDQDSMYGGLFAIKNSEIGTSSLDCLPGLFRSICANGNIWDRTNGINLRKIHKGKIELKGLALAIGQNLDKQIKLIPEIMDRFLMLRKYTFTEGEFLGVFANLADRLSLTPKQGNDVLNEFIEKESQNMSAFGVVNALTRSSQKYEPEFGNKLDIYAGDLIETNWDSFFKQAKTYDEKQITKLLALSV
jgi:hypothetical protein